MNQPLSCSTLAVKKQLYPYGYAVEYLLRLEPAPHSLTRLLHAMVKDILPPEFISGSSVSNIKGHRALQSESTVSSVPAGAIEPAGVLAIAAKLAPGAEEGESPALPARALISTAFKEFQGARSIVYQVYCTDPQALLPKLTGAELPASQLQIDSFRLGFELLENRLLSFIAAQSPVVMQSLLIECSPATLALSLRAEGLARKTALPLAKNQLFQKLDDLLRKQCGFELSNDYQLKLSC